MEQILSVGIDIGTSTTQIIFSCLEVENTAPVCFMPDMQITKKNVWYKSKIYFTPVYNNCLNLPELKKILDTEYRAAGIEKEKIGTGALIITGESANKENAEKVAAELSSYAGNLVVATAGCDLEAILAGSGSGARELSERQHKIIVNFDIGGGTVNTAVYQNGELMDAYGLHIGGRLVRLDGDGNILYVSPHISGKLKERWKIRLEGKTSISEIQKLCSGFAEVILKIVRGELLSNEEKELFIGHFPTSSVHPDACTFSGGVGEYVYQAQKYETLTDGTKFGDIGPFLGNTISMLFRKNGISVWPIQEKIRATVIGAGAYSMKLSGSTICFDESLLPLTNVPVAAVEYAGETPEEFSEKMQILRNRFSGPVAFALKNTELSTYLQLKKFSVAFAEFYKTTSEPVLLITQQDCAKVLGQSIGIQRKDRRHMICIDQIKATDGDYIDFCKSVGESILIIVKTLLFQN